MPPDRCVARRHPNGDVMDIASALQTQLRNIEATYGKPIEHWFTVIRASGIRKHTDVVAMLKADHGLAHGAAHRLSLLSRDTGAPVTGVDHVDELYTGAKATVRPLHDAIVAEI